MKKTLMLTSALVLAGLSTSALAADGGNWFVRGEAGRSRISVDQFSGHGNDTALSARGGYWFNPNFAVETFYTEFGNDSSDGVSAKLRGVGVGVVGKKNFGPDNSGFFIDGRAGAIRTRTSVDVSGFGSESNNSTKGYVGAGAGYDFSKNFGLSLNYDYTKADAFGASLNARTLTAGAEYRF